DNSEVGEVENIVIDLDAGSALALVELNPAFAPGGGEFLVPFSKLEVSTQEADTIGSSLLRTDFPGQDASSTAAATPATRSDPSSARVAGTPSTAISGGGSSSATGSSDTTASASGQSAIADGSASRSTDVADSSSFPIGSSGAQNPNDRQGT